MTIWTPTLDSEKPRYRAIADAIARDMEVGRLKPGDRLPTHRELADALEVTVSTITRGYAEAERRGLTTGEVGRGTFIRASTSFDPWPEPTARSEVVDLSLSLPVSVPEETNLFAQTLRRISKESKHHQLLAYQPESATPQQRRIAAAWLGRLGLDLETEDVLVTAGSQHGLNVVLSSLFPPGAVLLAGELTYPSIKSQARAYEIRLRGVELDEGGMNLEALERACQVEPKPTGIYVIPTLQNPTSAIMNQDRREELARLARTHDLLIVEDDIHAQLLPQAQTPIAAYAPERTIYLSSVAKCLCPGLRTGFLTAPPAYRSRLLTGIHTSMWMPPPLMVELTTRWIEEGIADQLIEAKRIETQHRQALAQNILGHIPNKAHPLGYQLWLELPEPWCTDAFVTRALEHNVKLVGAGAFAVNRRNVPHAVRLSIGLPGKNDLERGLRTLATILKEQTTATY